MTEEQAIEAVIEAWSELVLSVQWDWRGQMNRVPDHAIRDVNIAVGALAGIHHGLRRMPSTRRNDLGFAHKHPRQPLRARVGEIVHLQEDEVMLRSCRPALVVSGGLRVTLQRMDRAAESARLLTRVPHRDLDGEPEPREWHRIWECKEDV